MFEPFQDTFKYGFNGKVKVKFKVKYEKSAKKGKLPYNLMLFYQSLLKSEEVLYIKVNNNV